MADRVYLEDVLIKKRERLVDLYGKEAIEKNYALEAINEEAIKEFRFAKAMRKQGLSIIGEVKKASPSKGIIKEDFHPIKIAKKYETCVDAISVLTEEDYFLGQDQYLKEISNTVNRPTLCKDFILCEEQIIKAKSLGASCVLLIVAILTDSQLKAFLKAANRLGLDALVEVHNAEEVIRAVNVGAKIIGVNNRDLVTFKTDIHTTLKLRQLIPEDKIMISESGILDGNDINVLNGVNINGILVGESFMRSEDIISHAKELRDAYEN